MIKSKLKSVSKDTVYYITNYLPLIFSFAACLKFGSAAGILLSCIAVLFAPELKSKKLMPLYISFLILGLNPSLAVGASLVCGILLIISSFFYDKILRLLSAPVKSGIMLSSALTVTVLFTTYYFGIGASGEIVTDMIKSYISLGFHPNWRGVLYGTIVLVIMITFPRKFKTASKYLSPSFIALVFTLILNLFLNPSDMISAINEIPNNDISYLKNYFTCRTEFQFNIETFLIGISMFLLYFCSISLNDSATKKDYVISGISNSVFSGIFGLPLPYGINKNIKSLPSRIIAVIFILAMFFLYDDFILRIPLHSCAVVIIVGVWESVKWKEIKNSFNGILPIACFTISIIACLLTDMVYGILFSSIIASAYFLYTQKR